LDRDAEARGTRARLNRMLADAFGRALLDEHEGRRRHSLIIERDDGLLDADDPPRYFDPFRRWSRHERAAMRYVRGRVLDVGCGAGRCALYLQERGLDVAGIDVSPAALRVSRARGMRTAVRCALADVSPRLGRIDTVIMMGNNIGLLGTPQRAPRVLSRLHAITTDGGRIVGTTLDPHVSKDPVHLGYHRRNRARGRLAGQLRLRCRYAGRVDPWFDYLFVSVDELRDIVGGTGWQLRTHIESTDGIPGQYVAVLEKITP
jgi:SAM-dependent methyltransferase